MKKHFPLHVIFNKITVKIIKKNFISVFAKPPLKSDFPITKNHLLYINIKMKQSYHMKSGG